MYYDVSHIWMWFVVLQFLWIFYVNDLYFLPLTKVLSTTLKECKKKKNEVTRLHTYHMLFHLHYVTIWIYDNLQHHPFVFLQPFLFSRLASKTCLVFFFLCTFPHVITFSVSNRIFFFRNIKTIVEIVSIKFSSKLNKTTQWFLYVYTSTGGGRYAGRQRNSLFVPTVMFSVCFEPLWVHLCPFVTTVTHTNFH